MYDIVINADNVLMDVNRALQITFKERNLTFNPNNVYTSAYNSDLGISERQLLPSKMLISRYLDDPNLYRKAPVDWSIIAYIKNCASSGMNFLIYTDSPNDSVQMVKHALFTQWFLGLKNISFAGKQPDDSCIGFASGVRGYIVVDSCLDNFRNYERGIFKFLVDKPYNQRAYNQCYSDIFDDPKFIRCETAQQALEFAVGKAFALRLQNKPI